MGYGLAQPEIILNLYTYSYNHRSMTGKINKELNSNPANEYDLIMRSC